MEPSQLCLDFGFGFGFDLDLVLVLDFGSFLGPVVLGFDLQLELELELEPQLPLEQDHVVVDLEDHHLDFGSDLHVLLLFSDHHLDLNNSALQ